MKKLFVLVAAAMIASGLNQTVLAQTDADTTAKFVDQAKAAADTELGGMATELAGKMQALSTSGGISDAVKGKLNDTLKSLTGGMDSDALTSVFGMVKSAGLTPQQLDLAKQVGNLASAFVVQKNFASLPDGQGDVATLVTALRGGHLTDALTPLKNITQNTKLSDSQKQLITSIGDKYAPGLSKAKGALDGLKKFGF